MVQGQLCCQHGAVSCDPGVCFTTSTSGSGRGGVIPRGRGTSFDGSKRSRLEGVANSGVDGPVGEALARCREPEPLVAAVVSTPSGLNTSAENTAMVGRSQRCASSRKYVEVSILVDLDV